MFKAAFFKACCAAKEFSDTTVEVVGEKASTAKLAASEYTMSQLKSSLEGSRVQVKKAPDVHVTILEVKMQDGLEIKDILNFTLKGLKCRVQLEVTGTAAQVAGMVAAKAAKKVMDRAAALTGLEVGKKAAESAGRAREALASKAAEETETKKVEFDVNLDLGVRKAGEEVTAGVTIVKDAFKAVDSVVPVSAATRYVEEAISKKVKEIVTNYAKKRALSAARGAVGDKAVDVALDYGGAGVGIAKTGIGVAQSHVARIGALVGDAAREVSEATKKDKNGPERADDAEGTEEPSS